MIKQKRIEHKWHMDKSEKSAELYEIIHMAIVCLAQRGLFKKNRIVYFG